MGAVPTRDRCRLALPTQSLQIGWRTPSMRTEGTQFGLNPKILSQQMHSPITIMYAMWETYHVLFFMAIQRRLVYRNSYMGVYPERPCQGGSFNRYPKTATTTFCCIAVPFVQCGWYTVYQIPRGLVYGIPHARYQGRWYTVYQIPRWLASGILYTRYHGKRKGRTGNEPVRPLTVCVLRSIAYNERRDSSARHDIGQH